MSSGSSERPLPFMVTVRSSLKPSPSRTEKSMRRPVAAAPWKVSSACTVRRGLTP
ncbi:hypothetical protein [Variovorax sp. Root473]|uniref:hypothetical protein n=1 Tax=Variovorax sp. Root473 TaxID=1736541 RepID=UPI0012F85A9E|nr:hypothetical protein [Variovorax sp. Root473]